MKARRIVLLALLLVPALLTAQGTKSDSVVKAKAKADKIDADGKQVVTITLQLDDDWHIYANPIGNPDMESNETKVTITGKAKPEAVKIEYPKGELVKDAVVGDYKVFKGKVTIKAVVTRAKGDTGPLEATIALQACNKSKCLLPAKVKVEIP